MNSTLTLHFWASLRAPKNVTHKDQWDETRMPQWWSLVSFHSFPVCSLLKFYLYSAKDSIFYLGSYSCPPRFKVLLNLHIRLVLLVTFTSTFWSVSASCLPPENSHQTQAPLFPLGQAVEWRGLKLRKRETLLGSLLWILPSTLSWWTVTLLSLGKILCFSR